ncbi:hypothetical protein BD779DRAFT_1512273 [Infundibulicybe gibba]|nr:hypothetical protein BD779DRAFT_1512273 [Infundibulicybe gibba]
MSYASVAAQNVPPISEQPQPDPALLNTPRQAEGLSIWEIANHYLLRPGVAGGILGLVNVGLLAGAGRMLYLQPDLRRNAKFMTSAAIAVTSILSIEGYAAEQYRRTPRGREEERRARKEGSLIYSQLRQHILRPGVLGGLVGIVNTAVLGTVGYFSYVNWAQPRWDRRVVSAVTAGLLTLWGGEAIIAERALGGR